MLKTETKTKKRNYINKTVVCVNYQDVIQGFGKYILIYNREPL